MPDEILDYVKVVGRIGLTVGDSADAGVNPDMVAPDEGGTVSFTPLTQLVKVSGAAPPVTIVNSVIRCLLDSEGYLTYNGQRFVWLLDLGSAKVNPVTPRNVAAYSVTFDVRINGVPAAFPSFTCHPLPGVDNDLTILAPVTTGVSIPNVLGPRGATGTTGPPGPASTVPGPAGPTGIVILGVVGKSVYNGLTYPPRGTTTAGQYWGYEGPATDAPIDMQAGDYWAAQS